MKNIICLFIAILFAGAAIAQRNRETQTQYRTDISLKEQLKGTSVPNTQYRSSATKPAAQSAGDVTKQSRGAQIRNNAEPGIIYKKAESRSTENKPAASGNPLPSDKKAEPVKQQPAPEMPQNITQ